MEAVTYDDINELAWPDVPIKSVQLISNESKRKEYITKIKMCYKKVITPLTDLVSSESFNFSVGDEELTCRLMLNELEEELGKQDYTKQDLTEIVKGNIK